MTSSSTSASSLLSIASSSSDPSYRPPQSDDSSSFGEVMQKQDDQSSSSSDSNSSSNVTSEQSSDSSDPDAHSDSTSSDSTSNSDDNSTPVTVTPQKSSDGKSAHGQKTTTATKSTDTQSTPTLKSMLVRASVLTTDPKAVATPAKDAKTTTANADTSATDNEVNLAALIAQMLALTATTKTTPTTTTPTKALTDTKDATKDAGTTTPDIATLIAQAAIMAFNGQANTAATTSGQGKEIPVLVSTKVASAISGKEKKSASKEGEGSFLQSDTSATSTASSLLGMLGVTSTMANDASADQQLTPDLGSKKSTLGTLSALAANTAGTANVEREKTMNADQNLPALLNGMGTTTGLQQTSSDMQIKLSSNSNFENALKTVLHVASLNEVSQSRAATRVAIELQTPPGAIVNVYVTKQNDQWRAQLSTNDPQALSWVQDKMSSLKQTTDTGVEVKWLPPQIETITTSSSGESNLGWDRGGDGQAQYQNPDEREQSDRQQRGDDSELTAAGSNFMKTLTASGRAS